jgi:hypothetical protein
MFNTIFSSEDGAVYEIKWKNIVEADRPQMCMRIACGITMATHSECVIIIASVLQQWLNDCVSVLCVYVHCLSCLFMRRFKERYVQSVLRDGCYCYYRFIFT